MQVDFALGGFGNLRFDVDVGTVDGTAADVSVSRMYIGNGERERQANITFRRETVQISDP